jgi:hypothetical protein
LRGGGITTGRDGRVVATKDGKEREGEKKRDPRERQNGRASRRATRDVVSALRDWLGLGRR